MGRLQALTSQKNIISGLWTLGGVSATLIIPKQLFGILPIGDDLKVTLSTGIPGVLSSLIVGSATSVAVDTWVGREAGSSFFRGVMVAGIAQLVFQLAPNIARQALPLERLTGMGDYYTQFGYGTPNSALLADEANMSGVGDWAQVPEFGVFPPGSDNPNIAGVGDWFGTDVPVTAVGPEAAPVGENF
jgi:ABC-type thiamin/hydroxymethylpyrimidine transport system permease subunit